MENKLKQLYRAHRQAVGTFFNAGDASCMECLGYAGLDFVIIDGEHGPFDTETVQNLVRTAERADLTPVVRIADVTHREIQRVADCGAQGLIVPCLRTMEEFRRLVKLTKYPPLGERGFIKGRGAGFGYADWASGDLESFMANSNDRLMLIPQCETVESLDIIEDVAAMPGVDGIFIGPYDLSISMGLPGRFDHPDFQAAIDRIVSAFRKVDKPVYIYANTPEEGRACMGQGMDGVTCCLATSILTEGVRQMAETLRSHRA